MLISMRIRSSVTVLQWNISDLVTVSGIDAAFVFGDFNSQLLLRGIMREANGYTVTCSIRVGAVFQEVMIVPPAHVTVASKCVISSDAATYITRLDSRCQVMNKLNLLQGISRIC